MHFVPESLRKMSPAERFQLMFRQPLLPMNKPKLIIVEGPDCCGKSTLSQALAETLRAVYWHFTSTKLLAHANTDYMVNGLENAVSNLELGRNVVFDRFWPSEHCYRPVFRPDFPFDTRVREMCRDLDCIYIFCKDSKDMETAVNRHARHQDPEHPYDDVSYGQVYGNYLQLTAEQAARGDETFLYLFDDKRFQAGETGVDEKQLKDILEIFSLTAS